MFALLLPYTSKREALQICERIWHSFDPEQFKDGGVQVLLTLGVAELSDEADESAEDLLARAKEALQEARESGQHRLSPTWLLDDSFD
jgi:PleD family two-component response regulator